MKRKKCILRGFCMEDEFDKLMGILSAETEEKEKRLDEIFARCTEFFDKYKYVLAQGTSKEKELIQQKMNMLREKLKEENERSQASLGISQNEIKEMSNDQKNFTSTQWELLQNAQARFFQEKENSQKIELEEKKRREMDLKAKAKKRPITRKSGWMKS